MQRGQHCGVFLSKSCGLGGKLQDFLIDCLRYLAAATIRVIACRNLQRQYSFVSGNLRSITQMSNLRASYPIS
jgi:hypothetical protein